MVIFLDMPVEVSQKLMTSRYKGDESKKDVHECDVEFLHKCRNSALYACKKYGWRVISCAQNNEPLSIEEINDKIYNEIKSILK
jgi:dTMP kinase